MAGTLGTGGAEKQLYYMVRSLIEEGVIVHVYSLTRGEYYETKLQELGVAPIWVGKHSNPLVRLVRITAELVSFHPHIVQAAHFFTNLYVAFGGCPLDAARIGSLRNDVHVDVAANGRWSRLLLQLPPILLANAHVARRNLLQYNVSSEKVFVLPNVIDLIAFDHAAEESIGISFRPEVPLVCMICRLVSQKRVDRFLEVLAMARMQISIEGVIVGDGPERNHLKKMATEMGLLSDGVTFLGHRDDVPTILTRADILILTSDHEGVPNVILEAMTARLPVITTPAGDAANIVQDKCTGYVHDFDDLDGMAQRLVQLARKSELRRQLGDAGRQRVEELYSYEDLSNRLFNTYRSIAAKTSNERLLKILA